MSTRYSLSGGDCCLFFLLGCLFCAVCAVTSVRVDGQMMRFSVRQSKDVVIRSFLARDAELLSSIEQKIRDFESDWWKAREELENFKGTRWALLIAGSSGFANYRHQADICHAYQVLRKNGLREENIIVMMYDDIAYHRMNPHPGIIINHPKGGDVYAGVPKDYTKHHVTKDNFLAALLGNASAVNGGSGKVISSGPDDHVFVYYSDHGGPGLLGMPNMPFLFADDIVETLKAKHAAKGFNKLVFFLEACESGSIFEGLLPRDIAVYAMTASGADENSWGTYCAGDDDLPPPPEYDTCLGDLFSVSFLENSDRYDLKTETLDLLYRLVRERTSDHHMYDIGSHVHRYGNTSLGQFLVASFLGSDPANDGVSAPLPQDTSLTAATSHGHGSTLSRGEDSGAMKILERDRKGRVSQRDAEMVYLWQQVQRAPESSLEKMEALEELAAMASQRAWIDRSMDLLTRVVEEKMLKQKYHFGRQQRQGLPLVDDWQCLKSMVRAYEASCGPLTQYGMKHTRQLAELCNAGVQVEEVMEAAASVCRQGRRYSGPFSA